MSILIDSYPSHITYLSAYIFTASQVGAVKYGDCTSAEVSAHLPYGCSAHDSKLFWKCVEWEVPVHGHKSKVDSDPDW